MTQSEFEKLTEENAKENARYSALEVGQLIYSSSGYDTFEHEVLSVDVPNRVVRTLGPPMYDVRHEEFLGQGYGMWYLDPPPTF
jgi:hypothetical protein